MLHSVFGLSQGYLKLILHSIVSFDEEAQAGLVGSHRATHEAARPDHCGWLSFSHGASEELDEHGKPKQKFTGVTCHCPYLAPAIVDLTDFDDRLISFVVDTADAPLKVLQFMPPTMAESRTVGMLFGPSAQRSFTATRGIVAGDFNAQLLDELSFFIGSSRATFPLGKGRGGNAGKGRVQPCQIFRAHFSRRPSCSPHLGAKTAQTQIHTDKTRRR